MLWPSFLRGRDRKIRRSRSSSAKVNSQLIFQGITRLCMRSIYASVSTGVWIRRTHLGVDKKGGDSDRKTGFRDCPQRIK